MIPDIARLVSAYLIEPIYKFPDWFMSLSTDPNNMVYKFQHDPRIIGQLRNIPTEKLDIRILQNPDPRAIRYMKRYIDGNNHINYKKILASNKTKDPTLIHWINEQTGRQYLNEINSSPNLSNISQIIEEKFTEFANTLAQPEEDKIFMIINILKTHNLPKQYIKYVIQAIRESEKKFEYAIELEPLIASGDKHFMNILRSALGNSGVQFEHWDLLSENPNALEILNLDPYIIRESIFKNPSPEIIKMIGDKLSGQNLDSNESKYPVIYYYIKSTRINFKRELLQNPGAIGILETYPVLIETLFTDNTRAIILPSNISDRIVDILEHYINEYGKIPHSVSQCKSPKLIKLFARYKNLIRVTQHLCDNPHILSEPKSDTRLIKQVSLFLQA